MKYAAIRTYVDESESRQITGKFPADGAPAKFVGQTALPRKLPNGNFITDPNGNIVVDLTPPIPIPGVATVAEAFDKFDETIKRWIDEKNRIALGITIAAQANAATAAEISKAVKSADLQPRIIR
jgi:hypothetical protein